MNLEGIVSKRIDTPYRSGPFTGWRKDQMSGLREVVSRQLEVWSMQFEQSPARKFDASPTS
jgi:ATP-dependent DNA ligase